MSQPCIYARPRVPKAIGVARPRSDRSPCNLLAMCWLLGDSTSVPCRVLIQNISTGGLALRASYRFDPGTSLFLELQRPTDSSSRTYVVRVVHRRRSPQGGWITGCAFNHGPSDEEIQGYLR